ncbi:dTDP-glucose 4,6-dehydratase [Cytobacillus firmus]|jgi:UDP-glucose 4-epimerase|uniref:dTDP-glucose 4,6-dehydratase n=1 Tax=Cytobacillus firmus TaxID=1399 RepID=UPI002163D248|nr:NAD-dependent epimerase/dehydratase family protein [Cytobacillus firmus]MCS0652932.1 NAD-dependent epimerase/dehydratase family protein [Cytobacillus firmus]MCU1803804.1 NAD-dependent epimerase/dehydratase family protein [Cytobacillus firmus]WHY36509.1 NAD-dependent epimerase/dehydratase family protein [Cytobacillus firmus]
MNVLVTGGAGFIGRWVVKKLLEDQHNVWVLDDLSNGCLANLEGLIGHNGFNEFIKGDIKDTDLLEEIFLNKFDICFHLGASINVQDSIDNPQKTFENDTIGTFNILEQCKKHKVKIVFMSTCMVYDCAASLEGIKETDPIKPASPYAGSKIAAENLVLSYFYAYGLPAVVIRPFNTYGPFQKTGGEGGVVAIFIKNKLEGKPLKIYGDGKQTRDLLYVEDCANFVVKAGYEKKANGEIINAGLGRDIPINDLAILISGDDNKIQHIEHIHPQSEIQKLLCNYEKAKRLLNWEPLINLEEGIRRTENWIKEYNRRNE